MAAVRRQLARQQTDLLERPQQPAASSLLFAQYHCMSHQTCSGLAPLFFQ